MIGVHKINSFDVVGKFGRKKAYLCRSWPRYAVNGKNEIVGITVVATGTVHFCFPFQWDIPTIIWEKGDFVKMFLWIQTRGVSQGKNMGVLPVESFTKWIKYSPKPPGNPYRRYICAHTVEFIWLIDKKVYTGIIAPEYLPGLTSDF